MGVWGIGARGLPSSSTEGRVGKGLESLSEGVSSIFPGDATAWEGS